MNEEYRPSICSLRLPGGRVTLHHLMPIMAVNGAIPSDVVEMFSA